MMFHEFFDEKVKIMNSSVVSNSFTNFTVEFCGYYWYFTIVAPAADPPKE
jgi:hypothetical protein